MFCHKKLLSEPPPRSIWVCARQIKWNSWRIHRRGQYHWWKLIQVNIFWNQKGMIWFTPEWKTSQWTTPQTHSQLWLLKVHNNPRLMAPSMDPHQFFITGWWFWSGICQWKPRPSPPNGTQGKLRDYHGLGWQQICWHQHQMGLHASPLKPQITPLNGSLHLGPVQ